MKIFEWKLDVYRRMNGILVAGGTGNMKEFGKKMGCCRRTQETNLNEFRELIAPFGVNATYSTADRGYIYTKEGCLAIIIVWKDESNHELVEKLIEMAEIQKKRCSGLQKTEKQ